MRPTLIATTFALVLAAAGATAKTPDIVNEATPVINARNGTTGAVSPARAAPARRDELYQRDSDHDHRLPQPVPSFGPGRVAVSLADHRRR